MFSAEAKLAQTDNCTAVCDSASSAMLTVRGSLTSSSDTLVVWLLTDEGSLMRVAATDTLNAGQFAFSLNVYYKVKDYNRHSKKVWFDNDTIIVSDENCHVHAKNMKEMKKAS